MFLNYNKSLNLFLIKAKQQFNDRTCSFFYTLILRKVAKLKYNVINKKFHRGVEQSGSSSGS